MATYTSRIDLLKELQDSINDGNKLFEALTELQDDYNLLDRECMMIAKAYLFLTLSNP